jgi:hypothetical protein
MTERNAHAARQNVDAARVSAHLPDMWMSPEELIILDYLKKCGETGASFREICRKASTKDQWKKDERWAASHLSALKDKSLVTTNLAGAYCLPPEEDEDEEEEKKKKH